MDHSTVQKWIVHYATGQLKHKNGNKTLNLNNATIIIGNTQT